MQTEFQHEHTEFMGSISRSIKKRRKLLNLTQEDVAAAANVSPKLVGMVESGKQTVQIDGLHKILHVLGLKLTVT